MGSQYLNEIRYSYHVGSWRPPANMVYVVNDPVGEFERHVQSLFLEGQQHMRTEEYTLALSAFEEASALILRTVHPAMPVDPNQLAGFVFPRDPVLLDALVGKAADIIARSSPPMYSFPATIVNASSALSPAASKLLAPVTETGLRAVSFHTAVEAHISAGVAAADTRSWSDALKHYQAALDQTPATEPAVRGSLLHDMALLNEKAGAGGKAQELAQQSVDAFAGAKLEDGHAEALAATAGILARAGNAAKSAEFTKRLETLRGSVVLGGISATALRPMALTAVSPVTARALGAEVLPVRDVRAATPVARAPVAPPALAISLDPGAPALMGTKYLSTSTPQKVLTIKGLSETVTIDLQAANAVASTQAFLKRLSDTTDIGLLTGWHTSVHFIAYLPHMYFFVLPMSIGDCHSGLKNLDDARQVYASVLPYPFLNKTTEVVTVWTRLAQSYLDLGDQAYRNARDSVAGFAAAKAQYENIVRADRSLTAASPLYADAKFAAIKARVTAFLAAPDPTQVQDNPAILTIVLQAAQKLAQIQAELNFFGFAAGYAPPFSFEYVQNTARLLAQHAGETEQRYIQFKSQAENEQFRRDQLSQQAEVARQSVVLEQLGVSEALRGVDVASASLSYAAVQVTVAKQAEQDFNNTRNEMLALTATDAWAQAASVGKDDEVKLTAHGFGYYSATDKRRSAVIQDLALRRTRLSQDLEAARLHRAITSAQAYQVVAQQQLAQAQARVNVARQRVQIAALQQRQAEENRDFLDMREFGARLWYQLAQQARRLMQRYLDMATEVAFLMERAYNAETERGLHLIRYDYQHTASGNLMGADQLMADIESFTHDHLVTTRSKKNPVKRTISLADSYPTQFQRLLTTGSCTFETVLGDFDRYHPGLYLAKLRNVELRFVGLAGAEAIAGTLRNIGVSRFRSLDGSVAARLYPADVMVLSQFQIREDALEFRFNPNELRLFENNGIETLWQLDLPPGANDFDAGDILDVQLVLYYDGFFDPKLETTIRAALPASGGASRVVSMKLAAPDELFYLANQGQAELVFDAADFPRFQKDLVRGRATIQLSGAAARGIKLRLTSVALGHELLLTADADGNISDAAAGSPLAQLRNHPVVDTWQIAIRGDDNPQLVHGGVLDLGGLGDLKVFFEYKFNYR